jgi:hypothetical protein
MFDLLFETTSPPLLQQLSICFLDSVSLSSMISIDSDFRSVSSNTSPEFVELSSTLCRSVLFDDSFSSTLCRSFLFDDNNFSRSVTDGNAGVNNFGA